MRRAMGETSTSLSVGIFSAPASAALISMPCTLLPLVEEEAAMVVPLLASFARSAWLVDAERATEKNRNT